MSAYTAGQCTAVDQHKFARLWNASGAPLLVGYEAVLVAILARSDLADYRRVVATDLDDPAEVLNAIATIQGWRSEVAAGTRSISFGPRAARSAAHEVDLRPLPKTASRAPSGTSR
jgi:hypothetical protein